MTTLNYGSTSLEPGLDRDFERALAASRAGVDTPLGHVVGGGDRHEGDVFERRDPADPGRVVARAHAAGKEVVDDAVAAGRAAARGWRALPFSERVTALRAAKSRFVDNAVDVAATISAETGKSRIEALAEAQESADLIEHYCAQMESRDGFVTPLRPTATDTTTDVLRPYGVFAVLAPFNFPVALAVNMAAAALVTGNTVVLKPSDKTPRSTALAAQLLAASLPDGVLNVIQGGADTGRMLTAADVDGVAFTGSAAVGWGLIRTLSAGAYAKPVLAEMGGSNPAIVMATADLDDAVEGIVRSAFGFSGQKCSATRRVVVDRSVHDDLVARLASRIEQIVVGDPASSDVFVGPVIDEHVAARVHSELATARADGATIISTPCPDGPGHFVSPTVVTGLPRGHRQTRDELFAPVVTVTAVNGIDEALAEANAVDYGLSAGIFSGVTEEVDRFLDEIHAGVVYVNRREGATTGAWPGLQSFCGWKASGSSGKGGLGPWYLPGFMREQSRTISSAR
ncbi:aldehyde dehydrogenase family protein [Mycolicibacterium sediminis]|uniref:L-glutamate gamma-semialdehyde dehydrogenase n=1 Tax=Mycolicibacterium sediminis TaxID=1286180 RepID=A0A7I7QRR7_9MYCO|nr:aldehyde dehydrogenase family protein [Mycolicibacterium sediminis]BBY28506.1 aldehyde dehydrogenase [Mycolicibacterium sediminis]